MYQGEVVLSLGRCPTIPGESIKADAFGHAEIDRETGPRRIIAFYKPVLLLTMSGIVVAISFSFVVPEKLFQSELSLDVIAHKPFPDSIRPEPRYLLAPLWAADPVVMVFLPFGGTVISAKWFSVRGGESRQTIFVRGSESSSYYEKNHNGGNL
jgi:hypothetical protein